MHGTLEIRVIFKDCFSYKSAEILSCSALFRNVGPPDGENLLRQRNGGMYHCHRLVGYIV